MLVLLGETEGGGGEGIALLRGLELKRIDDGCGEGLGFIVEGFKGSGSAGGEFGAGRGLEKHAD